MEELKQSDHSICWAGDETDFSLVPQLKSFADWLLKVIASGKFEAIFPASSREYATLVRELWKDSAIQATYKRRSELQLLPAIRSYFLERVICSLFLSVCYFAFLNFKELH